MARAAEPARGAAARAEARAARRNQPPPPGPYAGRRGPPPPGAYVDREAMYAGGGPQYAYAGYGEGRADPDRPYARARRGRPYQHGDAVYDSYDSFLKERNWWERS